MSFQKQFRSRRQLKISDADAALRPLTRGSKAEDRAAVQALAEHIAQQQEVFYAAHDRKMIVVLQGMDTSGKDGAVRGVFGSVDPLGIRSVAFKAPGTVEKEHDYLWRIHQQVPGQGEIVLFNRSHYEDVLVTRVHGWIDGEECKRRYAHICDFERMLAETGTVILKFFLHISRDEQKRRLEERLADPAKHWKFDPNDLEERKHWTEYQDAYARAIRETDADHAPWYVIPSDSKTNRNLAIASIVAETLDGMALRYPPARPDFTGLTVD